MSLLDTEYPTIVFNKYLIDPLIIINVIKKYNKELTKIQYCYKDIYNSYICFI